MMPDREKVIKKAERIMCSTVDRDIIDSFCEDVLALLKEQEAVEPKKTAYQRVDHTIAYRYRCGTCDMSIFPSYKYCPFCGQAVKWDA